MFVLYNKSLLELMIHGIGKAQLIQEYVCILMNALDYSNIAGGGGGGGGGG